MPRRPSRIRTCWAKGSPSATDNKAERHAEFLNRYGNLMLFHYGYNIPASNRSSADKKDYYRESDVLLTQELVNYERGPMICHNTYAGMLSTVARPPSWPSASFH